VESIIVDAGGGGNPNGAGTGPANGAVASNREDVQENKKPDANTEPADTPKLEAPKKPAPDLPKPENNEQNRQVDVEASAAGQRLNVLGNKLRSQLDVVAGLGKGGLKGGGGGEGEGKGPGTGSGVGVGVQSGPATIHQRRQNRWTLTFETNSGMDYLRQLRGLDATLAVPESGGEYLVFRKLGQHPPHGQHEDINKIPGLHWFDTKPENVRSLATALGLDRMPEYIIAFFPPSLEKHLRNLEEQAYSGPEDEIDETYFRVVRRGGGRYDVVVDEIKNRR
jgi:hypothetical protein